ncbi:RNA polymerase sigma factor [Allorhizocola rhizosphaerae]|uniref:RNA polymerase sigma factor n=1 Tax=Allorhizocola rhizosphaerae TaxID=1872709 RepID=UPI000E3BE3F2|nr:sigma-70 family RNA polymerase sigma factor [Allorhizocola rhizosphaerae]
MTFPRDLEGLLRENAPQVLAALVRRYGHFDAAEDAVQEALLAAATQWPAEGVPGEPRTWLIRVASRRLIDQLRSDQSRRERENRDFAEAMRVAPARMSVPGAQQDDSLLLLFLCCHPVLSPASQVALTLRAVGGLSTTEIAHAFLVPEATIGQRITRAKRQIKESGIGFAVPDPADHAGRITTVLQILYLIFNEGYAATAGTELQRLDLAGEAIRLTRMLHGAVPQDGEVAGLLALMLLTHARRAVRTDAQGVPIPLAEQDRSLWDATEIASGIELVTDAMSRTELGPYQLQAAIAAVHAEAPSAAETDWKQILGLYELLERFAPGPVTTLNKAVALAMVHGPRAGLRLLSTLEGDKQLAAQHRLEAVRGHLLEMAGDNEAARAALLGAARRTTSAAEQRYLQRKAQRLNSPGG